MRIHKHPKKAQHKPHKLDQNITPTASNPGTSNTTCLSLSDKIDEDDNEFVFSDSPTLNDTFEHAARIATVAECFNLTKFKDFQRKVINNTMSGKDSIVVQPTGSGN